MLKSDLKKHAALYGIFLGIIVLIFAILVVMTLLSRSSWRNGLSLEVQRVLNEYDPDVYTVNKFIDVNSPLSTSSAVYSLIKKGAPSSETYYGVIIRIQTITGPASAVFVTKNINSGNYQVWFAGFAENFGKASPVVDKRLSNSSMEYWESLIPRVIEKSVVRQGR